MCFVEVHQSHKCSDVSKVVDEFRKQMTNDINNMVAVIGKCQDKLREHENKKEDFNKTVHVIETEERKN